MLDEECSSITDQEIEENKKQSILRFHGNSYKSQSRLYKTSCFLEGGKEWEKVTKL